MEEEEEEEDEEDFAAFNKASSSAQGPRPERRENKTTRMHDTDTSKSRQRLLSRFLE